MNESLHYLIMTDHFMFQKILFSNIKNTDLTLGQPKVLDYLKDHDGAIQKDIASACHIEPASLTAVLNGMEKNELIERRMCNGNRRSIYIFLTDKGKDYANLIENEFNKIEEISLQGFTEEEKNNLINYLSRIYENIHKSKS